MTIGLLPLQKQMNSESAVGRHDHTEIGSLEQHPLFVEIHTPTRRKEVLENTVK